MKRLLAFLILPALGAAGALGQYEPPKPMPPDEAALKQIVVRTDALGKLIERMRTAGVKDPFLADIEIYHKAAVWIVKHGEFYNKDAKEAAKWTSNVLDRGFLRASQQAAAKRPGSTHPVSAPSALTAPPSMAPSNRMRSHCRPTSAETSPKSGAWTSFCTGAAVP